MLRLILHATRALSQGGEGEEASHNYRVWVSSGPSDVRNIFYHSHHSHSPSATLSWEERRRRHEEANIRMTTSARATTGAAGK
jgi:hypothetical protein